jgi:hypothetical protein
MVGANVQSLSCLEGGGLICQCCNRSDDSLAILALSVSAGFVTSDKSKHPDRSAAFRAARFLVDTVFA